VHRACGTAIASCLARHFARQRIADKRSVSHDSPQQKGPYAMWWSKQSRVRRSSRSRLCFERCEPRNLLAVTTSFDNTTGTLTITGDADADVIAIFGTANPGEFTIQGSGTTVDGGTSATIGGVTGNMIIRLEDGNDVLNLDNVYLAGELDVRTGNGDDRIVLGATGVVSTAGHCWLQAEEGNDVIRAENYKVFIKDQLFITMRGRVRNTISVVGASALGEITIFGGDSGTNDIVLRGVTAGLSVDIRGGAPINNIAVFNSAASRVLQIRCEDGQNSIYIDTCYAGRFLQVNSFSSASGYIPEPPKPAPYNIDDTVTIARCQTPQIVVHTGLTGAMAFFGGNDTVDLYANYIVGPPTQVTLPTYAPVHVVYVETGEGNDTMNAAYNTILGQAIVSMLRGDDYLALIGNVFTGFASADGGEGANRLRLFGNQFAGFAATRFQ
jgi:hypothetical protein